MGSERHPLVPQTSTLDTEKTPLRRQWELLLDVFSTLGQPYPTPMKRVLHEHLKQRLFKPAGQRPPSLSKSICLLREHFPLGRPAMKDLLEEPDLKK